MRLFKGSDLATAKVGSYVVYDASAYGVSMMVAVPFPHFLFPSHVMEICNVVFGGGCSVERRRTPSFNDCRDARENTNGVYTDMV